MPRLPNIGLGSAERTVGRVVSFIIGLNGFIRQVIRFIGVGLTIHEGTVVAGVNDQGVFRYSGLVDGF